MRLERYCYGDGCTQGRLRLASGAVLHTLERPWVAGMPGGMPFVSCVPDGRYSLVEHGRPNGDRVPALRNPDLGVYYSKTSVPPEGGRTLILIHAANWVDQLHGCIAPGIGSTVSDNRMMVTNSRAAMVKVMESFDNGDDELVIVPSLGTKE